MIMNLGLSNETLQEHLSTGIKSSSLTMPHLKGMYAPGNDCAHILAPAGFSLFLPPDVFRFNRVAPMYPPDPCIRPNEGDLVCPPERPPCPV